MKKCSICKIDKPKDSFNKHSDRSDGLQSHCRDCGKEQSKAYYKRNLDKHKDRIKKYFKLKPRKICVMCKKRTVKFKEIDNIYLCMECKLRDLEFMNEF